MSTSVYRARWVLTGDGQPVDGGSVSIGDGRFVEISSRSPAGAVDLGDVAILPGFVNAHSHLDLSYIEQRVPRGNSFADWLRGVVALRLAHDPQKSAEPIDKAIQTMIQGGTTTVGDVTVGESARKRLSTAALGGVVFREVIGQTAARYESLWEAALDWLTEDSPILHPGLSPHAPYSTSAKIYRRAAQAASPLPIATHWLETDEERQFLATGVGPMADFLCSLGAWSKERLPVGDPWEKCLGANAATNARWLLVHANYLDEGDLDRLSQTPWKERVSGVVYCPRTHAYFEHPPHPWREILRRDIPVALGTDSLASNPDLSIYEEARFLTAGATPPSPAELLEMLTLAGAKALGLEERKEAGRLSTGYFANMTVIRPDGGGAAIGERLFGGGATVVGTMAAGNWLFDPQLNRRDQR